MLPRQARRGAAGSLVRSFLRRARLHWLAMSRQRSARSAALGLTVRRVPSTVPARGAGAASPPSRRRRSRHRVARPHLDLVQVGRDRPARRRPVCGRDGATALRSRVRARRPALPRRLQLGGQPAQRAQRGEDAPGRESRPSAARRSRASSRSRRTSTSGGSSITSTARASRRISSPSRPRSSAGPRARSRRRSSSRPDRATACA